MGKTTTWACKERRRDGQNGWMGVLAKEKGSDGSMLTAPS